MKGGIDPFEDGTWRASLLTQGQADAVRSWLERAAPQIGLGHWRFDVSRLAADPDHRAQSVAHDHRDELIVSVGREFLSETQAEQTETLAHELIHPLFYRLTRLVRNLVKDELGNTGEAVLFAAMHDAEEQAIERLAHAIAPSLPLFQMPAEGERERVDPHVLESARARNA